MEKNKVRSFPSEVWVKLKTKAPTKKVYYAFSNYGRIKSTNKLSGKEFLLKGSILKRSGLKTLNIWLEGNLRQSFYIHKLVANEFIENEGNHKFLIHLDGDKLNNHSKNIKWVSREELTADQIKRGIYDRPHRKPSVNTKMTESKVRLLRKRLKAGKTKRKILAKSFNITETQLRRIESGENWGHVKD